MCGRGFHLGQRSVVGIGLGVLSGAPAFAGAMAPFPRGANRGYAARRRRRFRGRAPRGGSGNASRSESVPASSCGGSPSPSLSPSALMTSCASSSVGDRGRVLRGAAGSAIAMSLCLRAGGGVRMSRGWCVGALVRCSLWGWRGGRPRGGCFHRCEGCLVSGARPFPGRSSSGACSQGSATRVSRVRSMRACGPSTGPTACALAGRRCSLWGWRKGVPGGMPSTVVRGAWCQALSLPRPRSSSVACSQGSATRVSRARSMRACGPSTGPTVCALAGRRCSLWGWRNGVPGGVLSTVVRGAWCQALSLPGRSSSGARSQGSATRVSGRGRCGRVDPVPVPRRAPLRAGVVRRGGGGRASPGGAAFHRCEGRLVSGTVPSSAARPPERAARFRDPRVPGAVDAGSGPGTGPTACALAGRRCSLWGWRKGVPGGGCLPPL